MSWLDHSEQTGWPYDGRWLANSPQPVPDGYLFETYPGRGGTYSSSLVFGGSGTIQETAIFLPAGVKIWKLAYMNGNTAGTSVTHRWMQLKATEGRVLGATLDAAAAPTANALNSHNLAQVASAMTASGTTVTATVPTTVSYAIGDSITVSSAAGLTNVNGTWTVASVASPTTITFGVASAPTGTYTASSASITMPIVTPYSGLYYLGALLVGTTLSFTGIASNSQLNTLPPILCGTGATSQTTPPAPNTLQALTTPGANLFYGCVG